MSTVVDGHDSVIETESVRFADVNGDGRDDLCYALGGVVRCHYRDIPSGSPDACEFDANYLETEFNFHLVAGLDHSTTIGVSDLNQDNRLDVCARGPDGIHCSKNYQNATFYSPYRWTTRFSDAEGWDEESKYSTLKYVDVDGDGRTDVCGREDEGIRCLFSNGYWFIDGGIVTEHGDFSNSDLTAWTNWGSSPTHYETIDFADIDDDGDLDVCGRGRHGIYCALFDYPTRTFEKETRWVSNQFLDAYGWNQEPYGTTIQFGDINGDGAADVCGRGGANIYCGVANVTQSRFDGADQGAASIAFPYWDGWNAENRYDTIVMTDADGDGLQDMCGRGYAGIYCAFSESTIFGGISFTDPTSTIVSTFGDNGSWHTREQFWGSVQPASVNSNPADSEFCGVGWAGVYCSQ